MGHIFNLSTYLSKQDLLTIDNQTQNSSVIKEISLINKEILSLVAESDKIDHQSKDFLYKLSILLEKFVTKFGRELKFLPRLRIEFLELLNKINQLNVYRNNFTSELLKSMAHLLKNQMENFLSVEMIKELIVYETFEHLGLTSELGVQGKLSIAKVRDVDTYSMLMSKYKKPHISTEYLEHYFNLNRNELLQYLVSKNKNIKHVHYDFEYLQQFVSLKLLLTLNGVDINTHLNEEISHVFV